MELVLHRPKDLEMLLLLLFILFMNSVALVLCASVVSELNPKHWLPFKKTWRNDNLRCFFSAVYLFSVWWGFIRNYESVWTHFGSECCRWSHMYTNTTPCVNIQRERYSLYTHVCSFSVCLFLPSGVDCDNIVVQLLWERFGAGEQYLPFYGFVSCVARLQVLFGKSMTGDFFLSILQHYPYFATQK